MLGVLIVVVLVVAWLLGNVNSTGSGSDSGSSGGIFGDALKNLALAIYEFEDPKRDAVATKQNNPGNLRPPGGSSTFWPGQTGVNPSNGIAIFQTFEDGFNALLGDLRIKSSKHPDWNLQNLFNVWLGGGPNTAPPSSEGNAVTYARFVADKLGVAITTTLGSLVKGGNNG